MSSVLTWLTKAQIDENVKEINGKTLSRPILYSGDGEGETYVVDVDVGDTEQQILYNVPIAPGNNELTYAEGGAPVRLQRESGGKWFISGFSKIMPGTYTKTPVTLPTFGFGIPDYSVGTPVDVGFSIRLLAYDELADNGGYGVLPYGAQGIYQGGVLLEVK